MPRADFTANRNALLAAASIEFEQRGDAVQLPDVAKAAGVGVGTVYRHFPNRTALIDALALDHLTQIRTLLGHAIDDDDPTAGLARAADGTLNIMLTSYGVAPTVASGTTESSALRNLLASIDELLVAIVSRAFDSLGIDADPTVTAADLKSLTCGIALTSRPVPDPTRARRQMSIVLRGLTATTG